MPRTDAMDDSRLRLRYDYLSGTNPNLLLNKPTTRAVNPTNGITDFMGKTMGSDRDLSKCSEGLPPGGVIGAKTRAFWRKCVGSREKMSADALKQQRGDDIRAVRAWADTRNLFSTEVSQYYGLESIVSFEGGVSGSLPLQASPSTVRASAGAGGSSSSKRKRPVDGDEDYEGPRPSHRTLTTHQSGRVTWHHSSSRLSPTSATSEAASEPSSRSSTPLLQVKTDFPRPASCLLSPGMSLPLRELSTHASSSDVHRDHAPLKAETEEVKANLEDDVVVEVIETRPAVPNHLEGSDSALPLIPLSEDANQRARDTPTTTLPSQDVKPPVLGPVLGSGAPANTEGREYADQVEPAGDTQSSPSASNSQIQLPTAQHVLGSVAATPSVATMTRDEHIAFTIIQSDHVTDEARDAAEELVTFLLRRTLREQANAGSASTDLGNAPDDAVPWEAIHEYALHIQLGSNSNGRLVKQVAGEVLANRFRRRLEQLQTST